MEESYLVLNIEGTGILLVEIFDKEKGVSKRSIGRVINTELLQSKKVVFETRLFKNYVNLYLKFGLETMVLGESMIISLETTNLFHLKFGNHLKLETQFTHSVMVKVQFDKEHKFTEDTRLQFILKSNLASQDINGDEFLEFDLHPNEEFPEKYAMSASGTIGSGLIKTINSQSEHFCIKQDCFYFVLIRVRNIQEILFLPSTFDNGATIKFHKKLELLEEIEPEELIIYKLEVERKPDTKLLFTIQPTEQNTRLFINPDNKITDLESVEYASSGKGHQAIVVTKDQLKEFGYQGKTFWVAFQSANKSKGSTFNFQVSVLAEQEEIIIDEDYFISGVIIKDEIVNYHLNLFSGEPETYHIEFFLTGTKGGANVVVKECLL